MERGLSRDSTVARSKKTPGCFFSGRIVLERTPAVAGNALPEESSASPRVLEHRDGDLLADLDLIGIGDIARAGNIRVVVG